MKNIDIRMTVSDLGILYKDLAAQMGISRVWLSKLMRDELSPANRERILAAIQELQKGAGHDRVHRTTPKDS